jgi:hypothetical protein
LIADHNDWELARARGYKLAISRDARPDGVALSYVRLPPAFAELGDGDVLGIHPQSGRVRVLYRRSSRHNFFLVTERCNNYCLMCSQPPKKVDDGWLIDDLGDSSASRSSDTRSDIHRRRTAHGMAPVYRSTGAGA